MASCSGGGGGNSGGDIGTLSSSSATTREELKSQFCTREGVYRLITALELSRSVTRALMPPISYGNMSTTSTSPSSPGNGPCPPLRLSFVNVIEDEERRGKKKDDPSSQKTPSPPPAVGTTALSNNDISAAATTASNNSSSSAPGPLAAVPPRLCFNLGKELFVFSFLGCRKVLDLVKPLDKRVYKGTFPTCHEFNSLIATEDNLSLLIGFSGGQIQLVDPISKEVNKLFNEDRIIDKTRVTCIRWVPNSTNMFLVSHGSGHTYLYNCELSCGTTSPHYQVLRQGPGYAVSNCKSKAPRNPMLRWTLGEGATNEFAFSPCGLFLAIVSQDGFLRIFRYENHDLVGITRSYFGGLLCVCWSPDCKYICVGGEDDLVTVWSFKERRVVARGQGHKSWVSVVAFDPYTTTYGDIDTIDECGNGDGCGNFTGHSNHPIVPENDYHSSGVFSCDSTAFGANSQQNNCVSFHQNNGSPPPVPSSSLTTNNKLKQSQQLGVNHNHSSTNESTSGLKNFLMNRHSRTSESLSMTLRLSASESTCARIPACYRVGSVGQDTQFCLWDLTEDILKQPFGRTRPTTSTSKAAGDMSPLTTVHSTTNLCNSYQHIRSNNNRSSPPISTSLVGNCLSSSVTASHAHCNSVTHDKDKDVVDSVILVNSISSSGSGVGVGGSRSSSTNATTGTDTKKSSSSENGNNGHTNNSSGHSHGILSLRFGALGFGGGGDKAKEHKRNFSLGSSSKLLEKNNHIAAAGSNSSKSSAGGSLELNTDDPLKLIGTQACPRLDECPLLEPLICKKISHERLTTLIFREESIVTACQDGVVCTWSRPGEDFRISGFGPSRTKVSTNSSTVPEDIFNRLYHKGGDPMEPL